MKRNDTSEFCILYIEPGDERSALFNAIVGQHKPVVILLAEQARVMQRPDDYALLKKLKRQHDVPVLFVIPESNWGRRVTHLATHAGFATYPSMDALLHSQGQERATRITQRLTQRNAQGVMNYAPTDDAASHGSQAQQTTRASSVVSPVLSLPDTAPLRSTRSRPSRPSRQRECKGYREERDDIEQADTRATTRGRPYYTTMSDEPGVYSRGVPLWSPVSPPDDEPTRPPTAQMGQIRQAASATPRSSTPSPLAGRRTRDLSPEMMDEMLNVRNTRHSHATHNAHASSISPDAPVTPMPPTPVAPSPNTSNQRTRRNHFPSILIVLTLIMLLAAGLGYALLLYHPLTPPPPAVMGHLRFLSSEQLSENSNQGIDDEAQLDVSNVPNPAPQKSYYAWLLTDQGQGDGQALLLGVLPVHNGSIHFFYPGDGQHTNLLATMSRLLVTQEDATVTPIAPSPDDSTWRYYGAFSTTLVTGTDTQGNAKQFSYLDHLRHLLASDPLLDQMELPGGLSNWLYRNSGKILEWTNSMREQWQETQDTTFLRNQTIRTLAYLDGLSYVRRDVPASMPLGVNDRLASVGILEVAGPTQDPPAYLDHVVTHLNGLLQASNTSGTANVQLRKQVATIINALSNVRLWFSKVRQDGQQLLKMSDAQLHQPQTLSLLNDMIQNATAAYTGQPDPNTGELYQGVTWIHSQLQTLAALDILAYNPGNSNVQMIQDMKRKAISVPGVRPGRLQESPRQYL